MVYPVWSDDRGPGSNPNMLAYVSPFELSDCVPPASGDWVVTESCTFEGVDTAPANVIVQNNATLTIAATASLDIDLANHHLLVKDGSHVIIKDGGEIH